MKELVLLPVASQHEDNLQFANPATMKGKFKLHSFIVVNLKEDEGQMNEQAHRRYQEYLIFKTDMRELTNHWNDASPCPVTKNKYTALTFKHLRIPRGMFEVWWAQQNVPFDWNVREDDDLPVEGWYLDDPLEDGIDLDQVRSLRESIPVLISDRLKVPSLRLVACFYSNQVTTRFPVNRLNFC